MNKPSISVLWVILFAAILAGAQDISCIEFCSKCIDDHSELCAQIAETCNCNVQEEPRQSESTPAPAPETPPAPKAEAKPISSVDFTPKKPKEKNRKEAIINVDFGYKGDSEFTAVKNSDNTYDIKQKDNSKLYIGVGVASLLLVILLGIAVF